MMMRESLLRKLIEKSYFTQGTEIEADYKGASLSGTATHRFHQPFVVTRIGETESGKLVIHAAAKSDGRVIRVNIDTVTSIDGMSPKRFAENYMIAEDGSELKLSGKRRGRRPKNQIETEDDAYDF